MKIVLRPTEVVVGRHLQYAGRPTGSSAVFATRSCDDQSPDGWQADDMVDERRLINEIPLTALSAEVGDPLPDEVHDRLGIEGDHVVGQGIAHPVQHDGHGPDPRCLRSSGPQNLVSSGPESRDDVPTEEARRPRD